MAAQLNFLQIMALIAKQYPALLPIIQKPGVLKALMDAVVGNWSPDRLQAALQNTVYYRSTDADHRAWDILSFVDPATAKQRTDLYSLKLKNLEAETGIHVDAATEQNLLVSAAAGQWSDAQLRLELVQGPGQMGGKPTGQVATDLNTVKSLASDYGVPISDAAALEWANKLTAGAVGPEAVKGYMIEQAKSLYPSLTGAIDAGNTVRQYVDPYAQIAARELNINPEDFNLSEAKWAAPIQQIDPKTGQRTAMTLDQWQTTVRTDPRYGYDLTQNGRSAAAGLTAALAQKMGVTA